MKLYEIKLSVFITKPTKCRIRGEASNLGQSLWRMVVYCLVRAIARRSRRS